MQDETSGWVTDACIYIHPSIHPTNNNTQGITFDNGCPLCDNGVRCEPNTYDYAGNLYTDKAATSV
jgi:hypothetical protein